MQFLQLKHYKEFKDILTNYRMSERAKNALKGLTLILLVAPSSTGRNTVIKRLTENYGYYFVISDTTRAPQVRDGVAEQNGVNYFFRTEEEILADLRAGEFLEAAIIHEQQVSGISIRELEKAKSQNKTAITDIEIVGADNVMKADPQAKAVFLVPPSFQEWQNRISGRGHMGPQELRNRLSSADKEFSAALEHEYYHFVITENVSQSADIIDALARGHASPHQERAREIIHDLQNQLQEKLTTAEFKNTWHS